MKKMMIATLALVSATVMAAPKTETKVADPTNGQPAVVLNVYDFSSKSPRPVKGNKISQSKNQQLC